jgi:hypothetical protein
MTSGGASAPPFILFNIMLLTPAIQKPLTKQEVRDLVQFLSYHLGYVPVTTPTMIFARTAKQYASLYEGYKVQAKELIDEINSDTPAFFDHLNNSIVFQGFSYVNGIDVPQFIIPISTVIHELIHFFQYATGTFGTYRILYEGTNDLLSCFLVNHFDIDYEYEAQYAFNMIMEMTGHNFWSTIQWIRTFTLHSAKNRYVHRCLKQCTSFSKYSPKKLLTILDDEEDTKRLDRIENEETRKIFTRYSLRTIINMCRQHRNIIQVRYDY